MTRPLRPLLTACLLALALGSAGCIFHHGHGHRHGHRHPRPCRLAAPPSAPLPIAAGVVVRR